MRPAKIVSFLGVAAAAIMTLALAGYGACANSLAYDIGGETTTVPMTTIDRICAGRVPDLIKMDIEGA